MEYPINNSKVTDHFRLGRLVQSDKDPNFLAEIKQYPTTLPVINPLYIFGIEVEVENVQIDRLKGDYYHFWTITQDNSLRNHGLEFVSHPLKAKYVEPALLQLNKSLNRDVEFSSRTSVHIHMNVRDLTMSQITNVVLIYTAIENILFDWIGHERDQNIFCIKLTETNYVHNYLLLQSNPNDAIRNWNKYTALNLQPMASKGTVEFRHMNGTADPVRIMTWINMLSCIKNMAKRYTTDKLIHMIMDLNSCSMYEEFLQDIFEQLTPEVIRNKPIQSRMEQAISYIKLTQAIQEQQPIDEMPPPPPREPTLDEFLEQRQRRTEVRIPTTVPTTLGDALLTRTLGEPRWETTNAAQTRNVFREAMVRVTDPAIWGTDADLGITQTITDEFN